MKHLARFVILSIFCALFGIGWLLGRAHFPLSRQAIAQSGGLATTSMPLIEGAPPYPTDSAPQPTAAAPTVVTAPVPTQRPVNPKPAPPTGQQLRADLARTGWDFVPVDPATLASGVVGREQALERVQQQYQQQDQQASNRDAQLGRLTNVVINQSRQAGAKVDSTFASPRLVWIVTLSGVGYQSSGPPGQPRKVSNELNVVVDATSGDILMDFVWTR